MEHRLSMKLIENGTNDDEVTMPVRMCVCVCARERDECNRPRLHVIGTAE